MALDGLWLICTRVILSVLRIPRLSWMQASLCLAWLSASPLKKLKNQPLPTSYLLLPSPWEQEGLSFIFPLNQATGVSSCFSSTSPQEAFAFLFCHSYEKNHLRMGHDLREEKWKLHRFCGFKLASHYSYGKGPLWGQQVPVLPVPPSWVLAPPPSFHGGSGPALWETRALPATHLLQTKHFWQTSS